jgi:triphosphoribosyl-dephospho-CoA synthase
MRTKDKLSISSLIASCATNALIEEVNLTPKPGLVDRKSRGVHKDMNYKLMLLSAKTLEPYFEQMANISLSSLPSLRVRELLGEIGREAEKAMMKATNKINTHKGAIWNLGLLSFSAGIHYKDFNIYKVLDSASDMALIPDKAKPLTESLSHGQEVWIRYGKRGAIAQAQMGFPHIRKYAYPTLLRARENEATEKQARINALLSLIATMDDTCILYRCGDKKAQEIKQKALNALNYGGILTPKGRKEFFLLHQLMLEANASPGGAADLLAATLFLDNLKNILNKN